MKEVNEENNKSIPEHQRLILKKWAVQPKYLQQKHTLIWARLLESNAGEIVNYDMCILGKEGLVSMSAVVDPNDITEVEETEDNMIQSVCFDSGYAYSDFDASKDKISDWTIGGLVAGGVLAKTGVLAKIGVFLLKFSKLIIVVVVGIGAVILKLFRRRKTHDTPIDEQDTNSE